MIHNNVNPTKIQKHFINSQKLSENEVRTKVVLEMCESSLFAGGATYI